MGLENYMEEHNGTHTLWTCLWEIGPVPYRVSNQNLQVGSPIGTGFIRGTET